VQRIAVRRAAAVATWGPLVFTADWFVLSRVHRGYAPRTETISSLSAHQAPQWGWMVGGQLVLAAAMVALATLQAGALGRRGQLTAGLLVLSAAGTVQASAFRTVCNRSDSGWCAPLPRSAYPHSQWAHGIGTGVAFGALVAACLASVWSVRRDRARRPLLVAGCITLVVAVPHMLWFLANAETSWHGWSEKVFLTALAGWVSYSGNWLSRDPRWGP